MVELAFAAPLLVLLMLGVGDFGRLMYHGITLTNAARAGAAYGAQSNAHVNDANGIRIAAENEAQNLGTIGVSSQRICECPGSGSVPCTTSSCAGYGAPRAFVEVTTTWTFRTLTRFPGIPDSRLVTRVAKVRAQ